MTRSKKRGAVRLGRGAWRATVALAIVSACALAAPAFAGSNSYRGKSDQNRTVTFKVRGGKVKSFKGGINMICSYSGLQFDSVIPPHALKIKHKKFHYKGRDRVDGNNIWIDGKLLGGGKAKGTIKMTDSRYIVDEGFDVCTSGERDWRASK